ncbi:hypothetical protein J6590_071966 [Homalodisca vitripennis]|nr:hypothetical protein J6590_071966 [Homalodisca vitripennis]
MKTRRTKCTKDGVRSRNSELCKLAPCCHRVQCTELDRDPPRPSRCEPAGPRLSAVHLACGHGAATPAPVFALPYSTLPTVLNKSDYTLLYDMMPVATFFRPDEFGRGVAIGLFTTRGLRNAFIALRRHGLSIKGFDNSRLCRFHNCFRRLKILSGFGQLLRDMVSGRDLGPGSSRHDVTNRTVLALLAHTVGCAAAVKIYQAPWISFSRFLFRLLSSDRSFNPFLELPFSDFPVVGRVTA